MRYRTDRRRLAPDAGESGSAHTCRCAEPTASGLLPAWGSSRDVRSAWISFLSPIFPVGSCYFTGTYSDEYGFGHALMVPDNVQRDFRKWLKQWGISSEYIVAVERHKWRDILHLHAIIAGDFSPLQLKCLEQDWGIDRGYARSLPVLDGCVSYVTKYALKDSVESFDFRLNPRSSGE